MATRRRLHGILDGAMHPRFYRHRVLLGLAGLWLTATVYNLTKPATMDDGYYLQIAQSVAAHPWSTMTEHIYSGSLWVPIFDLNQPHLLFWCMAGLMKLFGPVLWPLHLLMSGFTLAATVGMYRLAQRLASPRPLLATAIFILGPSFLPAQNLMVDVPLIALWIWTFVLLMKPVARHARRDDIIIGLLIGAACLMKYTALALIVALAIVTLAQRNYRRLWIIAIPAVLVGLWSWENIHEIGKIHILQRPLDGFNPTRWALKTVNFVIGFGALWPIPWIFYTEVRRHQKNRLIAWGVFVLAVGTGAISLFLTHVTPLDAALRMLFIWMGILGLMTMIGVGWRKWGTETTFGPWHIAAVWVVVTAAFIIGLSPFMAIRHILLIMPVAAIISTSVIASHSPTPCWIAVGCIFLLSGLLSAADWSWSQTYRTASRAIAKKYAAQHRWYVGHWSWQWYASQNGFRPLAFNGSQPTVGDILVAPTVTAIQPELLANKKLVLLETQTYPATSFSLFRTAMPWPRNGYYGYNLHGLPWTVSVQPLEAFRVYRVK